MYGRVHRKRYPTWTNTWLKQPGNNAKAAYILSNGGKNWKPWEAYTRNMHKKYLSQAAAAVRATPNLAGQKTGTPPRGKTAGRALSIAASQIGYTERGNNWTKYWQELKSAKMTSLQNQPWCGAFVVWVLWKTGFSWSTIKSTMGPNPYHVRTTEAHAKRSGKQTPAPKRETYEAKLLREARNRAKVARWTKTPKPGYLAIFTYSHIEIVEKVLPNGKIVTIGGNTSSGTRGSQNNGGGVYRRTRSRSSIRGFVRVDYDAGGVVAPSSPDWTPGTDAPKDEMTSGGKLVVNGSFNVATAEVLARYFGFTHGGMATAAYWREIEKIARFPVKWQDGELDKETVMFLQYATWQDVNGVWNATAIRRMQEHLNEYIGGQVPLYSKWAK